MNTPLSNPIDLVERENVQTSICTPPPDAEFVAAGFSKIDRATRSGAQDYALLSVLLRSGWRLSKVWCLCWCNISLKQGTARITLSINSTWLSLLLTFTLFTGIQKYRENKRLALVKRGWLNEFPGKYVPEVGYIPAVQNQVGEK